MLEIIPYKDAPTSVTLRRHLNCLDQDDLKLKHALTEHYIRQAEQSTFLVIINDSNILDNTQYFSKEFCLILGLQMKSHTMKIEILIESEEMKRFQNTGKMKSLTPFCFKAR